MSERYCETCGRKLRSTPESNLTQCCCCMAIDAQQELHDAELTQLRAENARLKSAHGHMEQELNTLRSREMNIDDIADYTESIANLTSHLNVANENNIRLRGEIGEANGKLFRTEQQLAEKDAEIERLKRERLTLARQYEPNCDEFDFGEQIQLMMSARQHVEAMQDAAEKYGIDPESCLVDFPDTLLGDLAALRQQNAELVEVLKKAVKMDACGCLRESYIKCSECWQQGRDIEAAIAKHGEGE